MMGSVGEGGLGIDIQMKQWGWMETFSFDELAKCKKKQKELEDNGWDTKLERSKDGYILWHKERS